MRPEDKFQDFLLSEGKDEEMDVYFRQLSSILQRLGGTRSRNDDVYLAKQLLKKIKLHVNKASRTSSREPVEEKDETSDEVTNEEPLTWSWHK